MVTGGVAAFWMAYLLNVLAISVLTVLLSTVPRGRMPSEAAWGIELPAIFLGWTACFALSAWLELPRIHIGGRLLRSLEQSFRVVASTAVRAIILVVAVPIALDCATRQMVAMLHVPADLGGSWIWYCAGLLLWWSLLPEAMRAGQTTAGIKRSSPSCERCGYNLWTIPPEGCCPECGHAVEASLDPEQARPGTMWERRRTVLNWCRTSVAVLLRPAPFYRTIRRREPDSAPSLFARWHPLLLGCAVAGFETTLAWCEVRTQQGVITLPGSSLGDRLASAVASFITVAILVASLSWVYYRTLGAGIATYWMLRSSFEDMRWSATIIDYESAFNWCVWAANILLLGMLTRTPGHFTSVFGQPAHYLGIPTELLYAMIVTVLSSLVWFARYRQAKTAVQWSNF